MFRAVRTLYRRCISPPGLARLRLASPPSPGGEGRPCCISARTSNLRQPVQVRAQHVALELEIGELAVPDDLDQARGLELLEMVRQRRRADGLALVERAAGHRRLALADRLQHLRAPRLGQRAGD